MNAGYVSAFAALAGSLIGGLTTFAAAWVTQRQQAKSIDSLRISVTLRGSLVGFVHPQRADVRPRSESPF